MKPTISIVIVSYNTKRLLESCVSSLFKHDRRLDFSGKKISPGDEESIPAELIIVDNASADGSANYIKGLARRKSVAAVLNKKNLGFGQANNQGMRLAKGEYILLLNSDTIINQAAVSQTLFWLASRPEYDVVGCRLLNKNKTLQPSVGNFPHLSNVFSMLFLDWLGKKAMRSPGNIVLVDWIMGAFMLLRTSAFRQTSGFDKNIFMYMEEVEWCYRLKQAGHRIAFYPNASIIHIGGASTKNKTPKILNIYRGLIYFYRKHKGGFQLALLKLMLKIKAGLVIVLGTIISNEEIRDTYRQAWSIS